MWQTTSWWLYSVSFYLISMFRFRWPHKLTTVLKLFYWPVLTAFTAWSSLKSPLAFLSLPLNQIQIKWGCGQYELTIYLLSVCLCSRCCFLTVVGFCQCKSVNWLMKHNTDSYNLAILSSHFEILNLLHR